MTRKYEDASYQLNSRLEAFLVDVEGKRLTAYKDTVVKWIIGVGYTCADVHHGLTITKGKSRMRSFMRNVCSRNAATYSTTARTYKKSSCADAAGHWNDPVDDPDEPLRTKLDEKVVHARFKSASRWPSARKSRERS
jgi:hypothetical protein